MTSKASAQLKSLFTTTIYTATMILTSCQTDPYVNEIATERPKPADVVGTYKFEQESITPEGYTYPSKETNATAIVLQADGKYKAVHLPNVFKNYGSKDPDFIDATGKWHIDTVDVSWEHSKPCYGIRLTGMPDSYASFKLMGDEPPYKLIITNDDPSLGEAIIFSKR